MEVVGILEHTLHHLFNGTFGGVEIATPTRVVFGTVGHNFCTGACDAEILEFVTKGVGKVCGWMERGILGVGAEVRIDSATFHHEGTEVGLVLAGHVVPAPTITIEVIVLHAGIAINLATDALDAKITDGTCQFLEVGMRVHGVKVTHHVDVTLEGSIFSDAACVVGACVDGVLCTDGIEGGDGSEHLLGGSWTQHLVVVVTPEVSVVGQVPHTDTSGVGRTVCFPCELVKREFDTLIPRLLFDS